MNWDFSFFCTSVMLGAGLAMDAFSVSLANVRHEPKMKKGRLCGIAGVFALGVRTYCNAVLRRFRQAHSVDCLRPAALYRRQDAN